MPTITILSLLGQFIGQQIKALSDRITPLEARVPTDNNFTDADLEKLDSVEYGAQANYQVKMVTVDLPYNPTGMIEIAGKEPLGGTLYNSGLGFLDDTQYIEFDGAFVLKQSDRYYLSFDPNMFDDLPLTKIRISFLERVL